MKLAVDALNLPHDVRGMGRMVRAVLRIAAAEQVTLTLLTARRPWSGDFEFAHPRSAAQNRRYDVVWYPWNGIRFASAAPSLAHIHDTFALHERGLNWIARRRIRQPLARAARSADRIATVSEWSRTCIERELRVPRERITVITHAPDALFCVGDAAATALPPAPYVLIVGAGDERKNGAFLVQAFADAFSSGEATLVAAGSFSADAERTARERGVKVVRESPDDVRLRDLYRGAACVAVPSTAEGFGLVVVEAQACGAPVIASNTSGIVESAGEAALLLDPGDRTKWRDALREVVRDDGTSSRLRALGAARWNVVDRDAPSRAVLAVLRDLVDQRS